MAREKLNVLLSAVLTTALDTEPSPFPETMAYLAMGSDMSTWETVKQVLIAGQLATFSGHSIRLTDKGRDIARKCNAALATA